MRVVLGYSGGLDTSVIVPWLREVYDAEGVCLAGDGIIRPGGPAPRPRSRRGAPVTAGLPGSEMG